MAAFYEAAVDPNDPNDRTRDFLERYLRLTHCDMFFADAAILVEGNVERLLMPQMIAKAAPRLQSNYLSVLEVGGAFGHRFKGLIDFLGLTSLIVTDIDSVSPPAAGALASNGELPVDEDPAMQSLTTMRTQRRLKRDVKGARRAWFMKPGLLLQIRR